MPERGNGTNYKRGTTGISREGSRSARNRESGVIGNDTEDCEKKDDRIGQQEEEDGENEEAAPSPPAKPRQWLIDRMFGKSPPPESVPPSWICYVPPCISIAPDLFEQNCFCERVGKTGVVDPDESVWRKRLMKAAVLFNFVAFCLAITSCFAISTRFNILQKVPFTNGELLVTNLTTGFSYQDIAGHIGLQAVAYSGPDVGQEVIGFDQFCDYNGTGLERIIFPEDCEACAEASGSLVFTLAVSAFPYLPAIVANVIRMYPNYDINCLKTFGTLVAGASMALAMYSYLAYRFQCFFSFFEGDIYFDSNFTEVGKDSGLAVGVASVRWSPGSGLICIILATALMGVDIILNLLLPTPSITRDHEKQEEYENQSISGVTMKMSPKAFVGAFINMMRGRESDEENHG